MVISQAIFLSWTQGGEIQIRKHSQSEKKLNEKFSSKSDLHFFLLYIKKKYINFKLFYFQDS